MTVSAEGAPGSIVLALADGASAPVSALSEGRFRYNTPLNRLEFSENTGAWTPFSAVVGLWSQTGTTVYPTTITDDVAVGVTSMLGTERFRVLGDVSVQGDIRFESGASRTVAINQSAVDTAGDSLNASGGAGGDYSAVAAGVGGQGVFEGGDGGSTALAGDTAAAGGTVNLIGGVGGNATAGTGTGGAGGLAIVSGGIGGTGVTANGVGGSASIRGGSGTTTHGDVAIGDSTTNSINVGNGTDNPPVTFFGTGTVAISGTGQKLELSVDGYIGIDERATDPATGGNEGAIYTKDAAGTTQLFYRASGSGTVYQLTPPGAGTSEWTRSGSIIYPNNTTDDVVIGATALFGTETLRVVGDTHLTGDIDFDNGAARTVRIDQSAADTNGRDLSLFAGDAGAMAGATFRFGGIALLQGGAGGDASAANSGAKGGRGRVYGGDGGDATGTGNSGDGGNVEIVGGQSPTPSGTGSQGTGGQVFVVGGFGDTGGETVLRGGFGNTTDGDIRIGTEQTANLNIGFGGASALPINLRGQPNILDPTAGNFANLDMTDGDSASVSAANHGRIRYNESSQQFEVSENGGAWTQMVGGATAAGWTDDGTVVRLTTSTDDVAIGIATMLGTEKLRVVGDVSVQGDLLLETGATRDVKVIGAAVDTAGNDLNVNGGRGGDYSASAAGAGGQGVFAGGDGGDTALAADTAGAGGTGNLIGGDGGDATAGTGTGGAGGNAIIVGGIGGTGVTANGVGGTVFVRGGSGATDGGIIIADQNTSSVAIGNATDNPPVNFNGTGTVALTGTGQKLELTADGYIGIDERGTDPTTGANEGALYTKDDSGATQLFYRESGSGTVHQLTPPTGATASAVDSSTTFTCPSGVAVRDVVAVTAADTVDQADADDVSKRPAYGIVVSKPTATSCIVRLLGELGGFSGLTPGATYYLSTTPGAIVTPAPSGAGVLRQVVGDAINTTTLVVDIERGAALLAS